MKRFFLVLLVAALPAVWAQTAPKTTTASSSTPAKTASSAASAVKPATAPTISPWIKLPPGVPKVTHVGPVKEYLDPVHYEDITVGTGAVGEPGKIWHFKYTGWRAADGVKFDSWDEHVRPAIGKDGKPELGPDGKPKMSDPVPASMPQGVGGVIPGFDIGITGMRIGGKRRIFIPWQLAYGNRDIPERGDHPGIPPKSDLIFDVELVDVTDMPAPRAMMPRPMPVPPHPNAANPPAAAPAGKPATPAQPAAPTQPAAQPATPPASTAQPATTAQPTTPQPATAPQPATPQPK